VKQGRNVPIARCYTAPQGKHDEAVAEEHGDSLANRTFAL